MRPRLPAASLVCLCLLTLGCAPRNGRTPSEVAASGPSKAAEREATDERRATGEGVASTKAARLARSTGGVAETRVIPDGRALVVGRVSTRSGAALPGVCVEAWWHEELRWVRSQDPARTNSAGRYRIEIRDPGRYTLEFRECAEVPAYGFQERETTVRSGEVRTVDVELDPAGSIAGSVSSVDGPLAGVCAELHTGRRSESEDRFRVAFASTTTDETGRYEFLGLSERSYRILFLPCLDYGAYVAEWYDNAYPASQEEPDGGYRGATPVALGTGERRGEIDATLEHPGRIAGRVQREDGSPYPCGTSFPIVYVLGEHGPEAEATQRCDGTYSVERLPPGRYKVSLTVECCTFPNQGTVWYPAAPDRDSADWVSVTEGSVTSGIDFVVRG